MEGTLARVLKGVFRALGAGSKQRLQSSGFLSATGALAKRILINEP